MGWWFTDQPVPGALSVLEEPEGCPATESPSDSNNNKGGSENAAALIE